MKLKMKVKLTRLVSLLLVFVMLVGTAECFAAYDLSDGGPDTSSGSSSELTVFDLNDMSKITAAKLIPSTNHLSGGNKFSALWEHEQNGYVDIKNVPGDWSDYYVVNFSVYGENVSGAQFGFVAMCEEGYFYQTVTMQEGQNDFEIRFSEMKTQTGANLKKMTYVRLSATGWGMKITPGGKFYINNISLRKQGDGLEKYYKGSEIQTVYGALENGVAVYPDSRNVVKGSEVTNYYETQYKDETVFVPATLFSDYLGANVSGGKSTAISANGNTLSVSDGSLEYSLNGKKGELSTAPYISAASRINEEAENVDEEILYVPAIEVGKLLGFNTLQDKKLAVIGDEKIQGLDSFSKANNLTEIAGYLAYHEDVDPATITKEDMMAIKDKWRYQLVADENIDLENEAIKNAISQISTRGKASWNIFKRDNEDSIFLDKKATASGDMTSEYQHLLYMTKAYAQYGSEYYHNEDLKKDILYGLEWMYENRYGEDEIENGEGVWRDHTLIDWYDWQIGSPIKLIEIVLLMEDCLTYEQKVNYFKFFRYWVYNRCYNSMFTDAGMNVFYTAEIWIAAALLSDDAEEAILAVSSLHNVFSWADTFSTKEGFFTDGSYVFHYKHPMTGQYGIGQFESSGLLLSVLKDSKLDFKNPRRENILDWVFDAFEPLTYDGAFFRMTMGRSHTSDNHGVGKNVIKGAVDLIEFADGDTKTRLKRMIKYQVTKDKATSYSDSSFRVSQLVELNEILNDDTIEPRDDYYISKVYNNMDKTVHHRKSWAIGISMSSSRIYDYECIHDQNTKGWYLSDGFTQLMLENDQTQFNPGYFSNIDPYKYPGTTVDTQERNAHRINTGSAFVKDFDDVGGTSLKDEYSVSAQHLNAFHLAEDITQSDGAVIKAHNSTLTARKAWFCFDDEVVCLGSDIDANDGFEVRTIVENRKANKVKNTIPEDQTTPAYDIVGVEASQTPQSENTPENTLDKDYATKWAGDGFSHIIYDLGEVKPVGYVGFAFMNGNKRTQKIDIELSKDGENWTQMFTGNSGGKTEGLEIFEMNGEEARYVKLVSYGNSDGGSWISLSEAEVYAPSTSGMGVITPKFVGKERVTIDGVEDDQIFDEEKKVENVSWVNLETVGGYYFPQNTDIYVQRTNNVLSFFEMWLSHGVSPTDGTYSYVLLPTMTAEQTAEYAANPGIEILVNNEKVQAVRDKSTGVTGIVFWEAGSFGGIKVDKPMVMMYREKDGKLELSVADTTHKLTEASITFDKALKADDTLDHRIKLGVDGKTLNVTFSNSMGANIESDLEIVKD